ncbi:hypothetical protein U2I54_16225 [Bacillus pseudomycoides]|uniref:Uncharacterized protein n=1 Tax=Bacillus bingmayongensis TaxID=1150157 RepID=A0ABU5JYU1_9BACI|nr:hypothetical protein [Bacillus pseudomycoides]
MNQTKERETFMNDNEFWKEVYYYMEKHNCYKDEAVEAVKARKNYDLQGKTVNEVFDEIIDLIVKQGEKR